MQTHQLQNPIPLMSRLTFFQPRDGQQAAPLFPAWLAHHTYTQLNHCFADSHLLVHIKMRFWIHRIMETLTLSDHNGALAFFTELNKTLICSDGRIILSPNELQILAPLFQEIIQYGLFVLNPPPMSLPSISDDTLPFMEQNGNIYDTCHAEHRMTMVQHTRLPTEFLFASISETTSVINVPNGAAVNVDLMVKLSELTELVRATKVNLTDITALKQETRALLETLQSSETIPLQKGLTHLLTICTAAEKTVITPETRLNPR